MASISTMKDDDGSDLRKIISKRSNDDLRQVLAKRRYLEKDQFSNLQAPAGFDLKPIPIRDSPQVSIDGGYNVLPHLSQRRTTPSLEHFDENFGRSGLPYRSFSVSSIPRSRSPTLYNLSSTFIEGHPSRSRSPRQQHQRSRSPVQQRRFARSPRHHHKQSRSPDQRSWLSRSPTQILQPSRSPGLKCRRSRSPRRHHRCSRSPSSHHQRSRSPRRHHRRSRSPRRHHRRSRSPAQPHWHSRPPKDHHHRSHRQPSSIPRFSPEHRGLSRLAMQLHSGSLSPQEQRFDRPDFDSALDHFERHMSPAAASQRLFSQTVNDRIPVLYDMKPPRQMDNDYPVCGSIISSFEPQESTPLYRDEQNYRPLDLFSESPLLVHGRSPSPLRIAHGRSHGQSGLQSPRGRRGSRNLISPGCLSRSPSRDRMRRRSPLPKSRLKNPRLSHQKSQDGKNNRTLSKSKLRGTSPHPAPNLINRQTFGQMNKKKTTELKSVQFFYDAQRKEIEALLRKQERDSLKSLAAASTENNSSSGKKPLARKWRPPVKQVKNNGESEFLVVETKEKQIAVRHMKQTSSAKDAGSEAEETARLKESIILQTSNKMVCPKEAQDDMSKFDSNCEKRSSVLPVSLVSSERSEEGKEKNAMLPTNLSPLPTEKENKLISGDIPFQLDKAETFPTSYDDEEVEAFTTLDKEGGEDVDHASDGDSSKGPAQQVETDLQSLLNKTKQFEDELLSKIEKDIKKSKIEVLGCVCCLAFGHTLKNCSHFGKMKPSQRYEVIFKSGRTCRNCLEFGHTDGECPLPGQCCVEGCSQKHHLFLHNAPERPDVSDQQDQSHYIQDMLTRLRKQTNSGGTRKTSKKGDAPKIVCIECGGNHNVLRCPTIPCDRCHETNHVSEDCESFYIFILCQRCCKRHRVTECLNEPCKNCHKMGHFVRICPEKKKASNYICFQCGGPHHVLLCTESAVICTKCSGKGHSGEGCTRLKDIVCHHCSKNHHIRFCPSRPCDQCQKIDHVTGNCQTNIICFNCGGDHKVSSCTSSSCDICDETGHLKQFCPLLDKFVDCNDCHGRHRFGNCSVKPCKLCSKLGHTAIACPTVNRRTICVKCGDNHHIHFCRKIPCKRCSSREHSTGECELAIKEPRVCKLCDGNHLTSHCSLQPCKTCKQTDHVTAECPITKTKCRKCHETGHTVENCPDADKGIRCLKCHMFGHHIQDCPFVECTNCGASGHWKNTCTNKRNEFRKRSHQEETKLISFDYNHTKNDAIGSTKPPALPIVKTKPLASHFYEKLVSKGRNPALAHQMMLYWELAKHNESTLKSLFNRHSPCTRDSLRLVLISELSKAPSSYRPMDVTSSELLDETIDFFMPRVDNEDNTRPILRFATPSTSTFSPTDTCNVDDGYDGRLKSLQPLQEFIAKKMRLLSSFFPIQEDYISTVTSSISAMLAQAGLCLFTLRRLFSTFSKESLADTIEEKMLTTTVKLPEQVSAPYVIEIVTDFLNDCCQV